MKRRHRPTAFVTAMLLSAALIGSRAQADRASASTRATTAPSASPTPTTATTTPTTAPTTPTTAPTATSTTITMPALPQTTFIPPRSPSGHRQPPAANRSPTTSGGGASITPGPPPLAQAPAANPLAPFGPIAPLPWRFSQAQIPLFLLPIYQAAGTQYGIPWQILAAINEVETNFGANLSVSSAGAQGWMQFEPSTWRRYGLDVSQSGSASLYDPTDAIFAAARYLAAAGAASNLRVAIFAYNHSAAYVDSVLGEARRIAQVPSPIVNALTGMSDGLFPVRAAATYAAKAVPSQRTLHTDIFARPGAPVIASQAGEVLAIGESRQLGRFVKLRDAYGTTYTYADLGQVATTYPIPRAQAGTASFAPVLRTATPVAPLPHTTSGTPVHLAPRTRRVPPRVAVTPLPPPRMTTRPPRALGTPLTRAATAPATRANLATIATTPASARPGINVSPASATGTVSGSQGATLGPTVRTVRGGTRPLFGSAPHATASLVAYTPSSKSVLPSPGLHSRQVPLEPGALVAAGTVVGSIGGQAAQPPHLQFRIRPATAGGPLIDPGPVLDSWRLLDGAAINAVRHPAIGQALLMNEPALGETVLSDPRIKIPRCGRAEIAAGQIDRRVLATLEYLAGSGLRPTVAALRCGHPAASADMRALKAGEAVEIVAINGIPIRGHQQHASITAKAIRRLISLHGVMQPSRIVSRINLPEADNVWAEPVGGQRIEIDFEPLFGRNLAFARFAANTLGTAGVSLWSTAMGGSVAAPPNAPAAIAAAIGAGNEIATLPYIWGGGHASFQAPGYDCSGSVSYALAAAGLIGSPLVSGQFENWGLPGPGKWISVYASANHVWMTVRGWRFDTVALAETGTRWASSGGEFAGFVVRHPAGL